jgi:hypothetical protein
MIRLGFNALCLHGTGNSYAIYRFAAYIKLVI